MSVGRDDIPSYKVCGEEGASEFSSPATTLAFLSDLP
jgi:hypothetical protein